MITDDLCLKTSQLTNLRKAPKKSYEELINFMWVRKPMDREHLEMFFHVDDLVLLSEFDDVSSVLTRLALSSQYVLVPGKVCC